MFHNFNRDISYILKRVIIGVLIALVLGFISTRKVRALDTVGYNQWNFIYRDGTVGQTWDNTFIYRLGENKSLQAVNVYWPSFTGYYNGTITIQLDPVQFPSQPNGFLTNQFFKLFVYQNGSYSQQYYIGTCDGQWTCTFNFQGTAEQSSNSRFSVQLLMSNDSFSTAYIMYPAARISASVFVSNESNNGNQDIINNNNENTTIINNNINDNFNKLEESQKVCKNSLNLSNFYSGLITDSGEIVSNGYWSYTDFIRVSSGSYNISFNWGSVNNNQQYVVFYDSNKSFISRLYLNVNSNNNTFNVSDNVSYIRFEYNNYYQPYNFVLHGYICSNGNQAINDSMQDINNTINDDNVDTNQANDFFSNFNSNNHGLSGIISAPLRLINSLSTSSCSPLVLPLPFVQQNATLPCMSTVYNNFPTFYSLWQLITTGLIGYWVIIKIYGKIHEFQDPNVDRVEVLDL